MTDLPRMVRARSRAPWTPDEDEMLRERASKGVDVRRLARLHGREPADIAERLRELGVSATDR